jgi:hypothetical protein
VRRSGIDFAQVTGRRADGIGVPGWLYSYLSGAGTGARGRYVELSSRWRRRVLRRSWPIPAAALATAAVVPVFDRGELWLWMTAVGLGVLLGAYSALLDGPPAYIEHWRRGLEGERRTAGALARLRRRGFVLLHDLPDRARPADARTANVDHVVVCRAGVFLLDSKWLGGDASLVGETVRVQMRDDEAESYELRWLARAMRGRALRLQQDIAETTGVRFVQPVVVFWNRFDAGQLSAGNVEFVEGDRLVAWLQEQAARNSPQWVAEVARGISSARPTGHRVWKHRARAESRRPGGL